MRGVIISGAILLVIVALMSVSWVAIEKAGENMCARIDIIKEDVRLEKWEKAEKHTEDLQKQWEKDVRWITMLVDHRETDEIAKEIYALEEYIEYREVPELMATASSLRELFEHIPRKERPSLENII